MNVETTTYQNEACTVRIFNNTDRVIGQNAAGAWRLGTLEVDHTGREYFSVDFVVAHESEAVAWAYGRFNAETGVLS